MNPTWRRVSKLQLCPVCNRPDWCSVCPNLSLVLCMRIQSGRPSKNAMGGWIHPLNGAIGTVRKHAAFVPAPSIDAVSILQSWSLNTKPSQLIDFATDLGVTPESLLQLGCCRSSTHHAWAFPMRDGSSKIIGIRLRYDNGDKRAVKGSRSGLFIPMIPPRNTCFICEGATDCAAALSIGIFAIGRPSCSGGTAQLWAALRERRVLRVAILADNDPDKLRPNGEPYNPGIDGAARLATELDLPTCLLVPPAKDTREFVKLGGTKEVLYSMMQSLVWNRPKAYNTETRLKAMQPEG